MSPKGRIFALRVAIVGAFGWLLIDGGFGRVIAIVGIVMGILSAFFVWLAKKIAGPDSAE
ncbi:MAG: hypothetical protein WAL95_09690 [Candidatus Acidiferrales bacterium]